MSLTRCQLCDEESIILDACAVIDFCGRTDNLPLLMTYVAGHGVITSPVRAELERQRKKRYPRIQAFLDEVEAGRVQVIDPDMGHPDALRVVETWDGIFGPGEVSSLALAVSRRWVFVSRDREPMQQVSLRETVSVRSTNQVIDALLRRRVINKPTADVIKRAIVKDSRKGKR